MLRICAENASEPNISLLNIVELAHALRVRSGSSAAYAALNGEKLRQRACPGFPWFSLATISTRRLCECRIRSRLRTRK